MCRIVVAARVPGKRDGEKGKSEGQGADRQSKQWGIALGNQRRDCGDQRRARGSDKKRQKVGGGQDRMGLDTRLIECIFDVSIQGA